MAMTVKSNMAYEDWLELADEYYLAARSLQWFSSLNYPTTHAGHHALELYLKAINVNATGKYDNGQHDLKKLYETTKKLRPSIESEAVELAVEKYWNYDQPARYTSKESKFNKLPSNNSMGSDSLRALDAAVKVLRDISVTTRRGIDRLVEGETMITKSDMQDSYLSLQSVIFFHFNDYFKPKRPEIMDTVHFQAPQWDINGLEV